MEERNLRDAQNETAMMPDPLREWFEGHIVQDDHSTLCWEDVWASIENYTKQPERAVSMALSGYMKRLGIHRERRKIGTTQKRVYIGVRLS